MNLYTIDECFYQIRNGANIKQGVIDGGFPITRIETVSNDIFNRDRLGYAGIFDIGKYESYILETGDLLMSHINSIQYLGRTVLYKRKDNEKIIHGMNLLCLKVKKNILNPAYAKYYFYSSKFRKQVSKITKKSVNQASFAISDLKKLTIQVPSLVEQEHIVQVLDKINMLINNHEKELHELDNLIKSRFVEMFDCYEKVELCLLANITMGQSPESSTYNDDGIGIPFFQGKADYGEKFTVVHHWTSSPTKYAKKGSVLMSVRAPVGPVNISSVDCCIGRGLCSIDAIKDKTNNEFLFNALKTMKQDIASKGSGSTFKAITKKEVYSILVPNAPITLQEQFSLFAEQVDKSKFVIEQLIVNYRKLYVYCLHYLFYFYVCFYTNTKHKGQ